MQDYILDALGRSFDEIEIEGYNPLLVVAPTPCPSHFVELNLGFDLVNIEPVDGALKRFASRASVPRFYESFKIFTSHLLERYLKYIVLDAQRIALGCRDPNGILLPQEQVFASNRRYRSRCGLRSGDDQHFTVASK